MGVELDHDGIAEFLKSAELAKVVHDAASRVATRASDAHPEADVVVDDYETDRAASSVTVLHPQAAEWQATEGILTRAAAAEGLEVTEK